MPEQETGKAFVIMPFDEEFGPIFEKLIAPGLVAAGFEVSRADDFIDQQNILETIVTGIADSDIVVADLTTLKANVLYELGIAHALDKPTVMIAQSIDDIPFDLRGYRIEVYSTQFDQAERLSKALQEIGERLRQRTIRFGNPVSDFLPFSESARAKEAEWEGEEADAYLEETGRELEEKGFLDWSADLEESLQDGMKSILEITQATKDVGEQMKGRTGQIQRAQRQKGPGAAVRVRNIVRSSAAQIIDYGAKVEAQLPTYRDSWKRFAESAEFLIDVVQIKNEKDKESVLQLRGSSEEMLEAMVNSIAQTHVFRDTIAELRGMSRNMNLASRRVLGVLDDLLVELEKSRGVSARVLALIDEKLAALD